MGRIEDNEAERMERMRQERKLQEAQLKTKQVAEGAQFKNFVAKNQEIKKQDTRGDQQRSEQAQQASRVLLARRGISANHGAEDIARARVQDNDNTRTRLSHKDRDANRFREELGNRLAGAQNDKSGKASAMGVGRSHQQSSDKEGQREAPKSKEAPRADAASAQATSYAAIGEAAVQALDGMGANGGRNVSAAAQAEKIRALLAAIVQGVKQGMNEQGFGLIEVQLNDDVLGGTKLTLLNSQSGVHLKIETGEHGASQTERPNEALLKSHAHELSQAMVAGKVNLVGLEVNGEKVIA